MPYVCAAVNRGFSRGGAHAIGPAIKRGRARGLTGETYGKEAEMAVERTLSIIKPDATKRNLTGKINAKFEDAGLRIVAQKRIQLTPAQAGVFYEVHKERHDPRRICRVGG